MPTPLHIVSTGTANTASVLAAWERLGIEAILTTSESDVREAPRLVLPGVGSFGAAMRLLEAEGLVPALRDRLAAGRPTLCICLGLQLLATASDESPGAKGLGVCRVTVSRLPDQVEAAQLPRDVSQRVPQRVPQLGWNHVAAPKGSRFLTDGFAYYANSYCLREVPQGWLAATTTYGVRFCAAIERAGVLACQFHPELSGRWGAALLKRWYDESAAAHANAPAKGAV